MRPSGYAADGLMLMAMGDRCWRNLGSDGVGLCARIQVHVLHVFTVFVSPETLAGSTELQQVRLMRVWHLPRGLHSNGGGEDQTLGQLILDAEPPGHDSRECLAQPTGSTASAAIGENRRAGAAADGRR